MTPRRRDPGVLASRERLLLWGIFLIAPLWATASAADLLPDSVAQLSLGVPLLVCWLATLGATWQAHLHCSSTGPWRARARCITLLLAFYGATLAAMAPKLAVREESLSVWALVDRSLSMDDVPHVMARVQKDLELLSQQADATDTIGLIGFAEGQMISQPLQSVSRFRAQLQRSLSIPPPGPRRGTDAENAVQAALQALPPHGTPHIVILTDGAQKRGGMGPTLQTLIDSGVTAHVIGYERSQSREPLALKQISAPHTARLGEVISLRAVVEATAPTRATAHILDNGLLHQSLQNLRIGSGETVLRLPVRVESGGLHHYELQLEPLAEHGQTPRRGTFVQVRGESRALVLSLAPDSESALVTALTQAGFVCKRLAPAQAPQGTAGFAQFDLVVLGEAPSDALTPHQQAALADYVRSFGGGLLLMGSPLSFGPGGYQGTPIEAVSPVSFDQRLDQQRGTLALALAIDYSGSMGTSLSGKTKLQIANAAAVASSTKLGTRDLFGVLHADTQAQWTWALAPPPSAPQLERRLRTLQPGGAGLRVDTALQAAYTGMKAHPAERKQVLLLVDSADAESLPMAVRLASRARSAHSIRTSVVALGTGADLGPLKGLAAAGAGSFHRVRNPRDLPTIIVRQTSQFARPPAVEGPFTPRLHPGAISLAGITTDAPPLGGYILTHAKSRADVAISGPNRDPILATWTTGVGRVGAFTSEYHAGWGEHWLSWPAASQLFAQLGRHLARSQDDAGLQFIAGMNGGRVELIANVLDSAGRPDDTQQLVAELSIAGKGTQAVALRHSGPGLYRAEVSPKTNGVHLAAVHNALGATTLALAGFEVNAADEVLEPAGALRRLQEECERHGVHYSHSAAGLLDGRRRQSASALALQLPLCWTVALLVLLGLCFERLPLPRQYSALGRRLTQRARTRPVQALSSQPIPSSTAPPATSAALKILERRRAKRS